MNLETIFCRALEVALSAPSRSTRVMRINSGEFLATNRDGSKRKIRGAMAGTGDLVGYAAPDGLHIEIECKVDDGGPRLSQKRRRAALEKAGCVYVQVSWRHAEGQTVEEAVDLAVLHIDHVIREHRQRRNAA